MSRKKKLEDVEPVLAPVPETEIAPATEAVSEVAAEAALEQDLAAEETSQEAGEEALLEESEDEQTEEDEDADSESDVEDDGDEEDEEEEEEGDEDYADLEDEDEDSDEESGDEESDEDAVDEDGDEEEEAEEEEEQAPSKPRPPAKLERLQKILAAAGVASRRSAEEMIEQGRVQVNGKIVTTLGTKADAGRDHIRVDGKLLQGAERLRYFVLNKPKGFVTTVKDPEGRPTVMQFFGKMKERLYPVGRLDYLSEGLLLVTNDGDLAHKLTKASSGVEKTYLVKVAGQPTEEELDVLRGGVSIPHGKDGSKRVRTSPARVRQVRQGENPWYEVVLIEGRNRELRKMFEEVGHFVEKIRRVGYGPLVLDQEPGQMRELDEQELAQLRLASEGKLRKVKEVRKELERQLPTVKSGPSQPYGDRSASRDFRPKPAYRQDAPARETRSDDRRPGSFGAPASGSRFGSSRPGGSRPAGGPAGRPAWQRPEPSQDRSEGSFRPRPQGSDERRPAPGRSFGDRPARPSGDRPARPYGDRPSAPRPASDRPQSFGDRPSKPFGDKPGGAGFGDKKRSFGDKPERKGWQKPGGEDRSSFKRPTPSTRADDDYSDLEPRKPMRIFIEPVQPNDRSNFARPSSVRPFTGRPAAPRGGSDRSGSDRPRPDRPSSARPFSPRPSSDRPSSSRPYSPRPSSDRPGSDRPYSPRPAFNRGGEDRPRPDSRPERGAESFDRPERPVRREGERRFTTSSGLPRPGGPRPSSKHPKGSRPSGGSDSRPGGPRSFGSKPGGFSRPASGQSRPAFRRDEGDGAPRTPRPYTPRSEGASDSRPRSPRPFSDSSAPRTGWKPKPSFGGKPGGGGRPAGRPGGFSKPGSKPGGFKSGPRPGGKKRG
jgi:23S rRNA pseudouridine2605 synthase